MDDPRILEVAKLLLRMLGSRTEAVMMAENAASYHTPNSEGHVFWMAVAHAAETL